MRAPNWIRSRYLFASVFLVWVIAGIAVGSRIPHQPILRIGFDVLWWASVVVYWAWYEGWRKFLTGAAPVYVFSSATFVIAGWFLGFDYLAVGVSCLATFLLYTLYRKLIGARDTDDQAAAPSLAEIWAALRRDLTNMPSWSRIQELQQTPEFNSVRVKASDLAGVVEYDSMHFPGMRVEEYAADWETQLSQVRTDDNGCFALPHTSDGPDHRVKVSWPGTEPVLLQVELSPDAQPLRVRMKPQKPKPYWRRN